jgi:hypothetical protein
MQLLTVCFKKLFYQQCKSLYITLLNYITQCINCSDYFLSTYVNYIIKSTYLNNYLEIQIKTGTDSSTSSMANNNNVCFTKISSSTPMLTELHKMIYRYHRDIDVCT